MGLSYGGISHLDTKPNKGITQGQPIRSSSYGKQQQVPPNQANFFMNPALRNNSKGNIEVITQANKSGVNFHGQVPYHMGNKNLRQSNKSRNNYANGQTTNSIMNKSANYKIMRKTSHNLTGSEVKMGNQQVGSSLGSTKANQTNNINQKLQAAGIGGHSRNKAGGVMTNKRMINQSQNNIASNHLTMDSQQMSSVDLGKYSGSFVGQIPQEKGPSQFTMMYNNTAQQHMQRNLRGGNTIVSNYLKGI